MNARFVLLASLLVASAANGVLAQSPAPAPPTPQQPQSQAAPASQVAQSPAKKPHRVITNDDLESLPHEASFNGGRELLDQVNTCDRNCFDQVARGVGSNFSLDYRWKQSLLNAVEKSKEDLPWQGLLGEVIAIQAQSCELQVKKRQDLARFADPNNVTHKELLVDREYEPKFREMTRRINEVSGRANKRVSAVSDPYLAEFMRLQLRRVMNATCQIYVTEAPSRRDSEEDPSPDPDDSEQVSDNEQ